MGENRICTICGKTIDSAEMRFCPFCGNGLAKAEASETSVFPTDEVRARYERYADWVESVFADRNLGREMLDLFTGNREFKNSPEHERFLTDVQAMSEKLAAAYRAGERRETLPELMQYVLLDCHTATPQEVNWMYLAAEQVFFPLLELLTQEEAAALYPRYRAMRKKEPGLGIQKNILKTLKTRKNE